MSGLARFAGTPATPGVDPAAPARPDGSLRRFLGPRTRPDPGTVCELCAAPMGSDHRHVVDLERRGILCTCRPCGLLFEGGVGQQAHLRTVPERVVRLEPFHLSAADWAALGVPVGMVFVVTSTARDQHVAFYPSPGGATESELPLEPWQAVVDANPVLAGVEPDVEAALVRAPGPGAPGAVLGHDHPADCHVVPVDRCYELVGRLRLRWRGFDGGQEVRAAVAEFFEDIARRARVVAPDAAATGGTP